jgi:hypothetical protein
MQVTDQFHDPADLTERKCSVPSGHETFLAQDMNILEKTWYSCQESNPVF